ncbi:hypothetical protein GWC77_04345 [Paraburkholderia sp. NMBU_R16]|uniref:hypothetical protein n=1 Tax=Paraburkholderia sp. NMBU_R16 TaxID=2698676 RepID=UPI001564A962|nr:hypothetical protein [Paraburkholderia sp. NMBU_R16]NRO95167.1 hypothetical protein [Paraburkholderia sp. NMBU_R16]
MAALQLTVYNNQATEQRNEHISRLPNMSPVTADVRPDVQSPGHADASQVRPQERQLRGALGGLARPPARLDSSPSSGSRAATAKFSAPAVQHAGQAVAAQASALQARFPEASATAIQGLAAEGFSADGIARIVGSEGGAAALAELYDNKYLSTLRAVGFSDDDIVEFAASGNGEQTIHQALQVYSALASASEKATGEALTGFLKIHDDDIMRGIRDAVGTPRFARMCSFVRSGRLRELQVLAVFGDADHLIRDAARGVMPPYTPR